MVIGVICEYNPFHNGHLRQLRLIREAFGADAKIVCLMSGRFVQRGEPAILAPSVRTQAALDCGADLVLELPITCALQSAEGFAKGAVEIFDRLGIVDVLCFGSESGDTDALVRTARAMCGTEYEEALRRHLSGGVSYAAARQAALNETGADASLSEKPNDILALEYCKALTERKSRIRPFAIRREGDYHEKTPDAAQPSAASLRLLPTEQWKPFIPPEAEAAYAGARRYSLSAGEQAMLARLRGKTDWETVPFGSEGLWCKVRKAAWSEASVQAVIDAAKSKRYVRTRLQRLLLCAYLGITQDDLRRPISFVRVLGFSEAGRSLIRTAKKQGGIGIVNAGEKPQDTEYSALECRAERLYALFAEDGDYSAEEQKKSLPRERKVR